MRLRRWFKMNKYLKQILTKLNITSEEEPVVNEQAVLIYFNYNLESLDPFYNLVDQLRICIEENSLGEYDGHEMAMDQSDGSFYMYSTDALNLFNNIQPILRETNFLKNAEVVIRYDDENMERIIL